MDGLYLSMSKSLLYVRKLVLVIPVLCYFYLCVTKLYFNPCKYARDINLWDYSIVDRHLSHWDRVTHICVSKLTIIGLDNNLSPCRHKAIIWTIADIFFIGLLGTNFDDILIEIYTSSLKKIHFKTWSGKWRPFCFGLNVLKVACCDPVRAECISTMCTWDLYFFIGSKFNACGNGVTIMFSHRR